MCFTKNPNHSDLKTVINFIPSFNKVKCVEEIILERQNLTFISFDKITNMQIDKLKLFPDFPLFGSKFIKDNAEQD